MTEALNHVTQNFYSSILQNHVIFNDPQRGGHQQTNLITTHGNKHKELKLVPNQEIPKQTDQEIDQQNKLSKLCFKVTQKHNNCFRSTERETEYLPLFL